ncbi:MAG: DUF4012 domain-containing protein [Dehalococcoidia bacterium]
MVRRGIRAERLTGPLAPAGAALARLDERLTDVQQGAGLLADLPAAARSSLGIDRPRVYAILGQNSAELRPTGGFIGSVGLITVRDGVIVAEDYRSSYAFDNPSRGFEPLPAPMAAHLGPGGWSLRDTNWSPDFPTAAAKAEDLLRRHQDLTVDGVIGVNTYSVGMLLEALGPLPVEGFDQPVTAETWYGLAERLIYFDESGHTVDNADDNKQLVLQPILRAVINRVQGAGPEDVAPLLRAVQRATRERQLQVMFHDPAAAALARRTGADGRFAPPQGDALALVDANLSYSKIGPYVRTHIRYEVALSARGTAERSRVTVTYENTLPPEEANRPGRRMYGAEMDPATGRLYFNRGVFGTYARLYIPRNSRILDPGPDTPPPVTGRDLDMTTIERYYSVSAGTSRGFSYSYQIPTDANPAGRYRLHVRKQSGVAAYDLEVRVRLPAGMGASANLPTSVEGNTLIFRSDVFSDLDLVLRLEQPTP